MSAKKAYADMAVRLKDTVELLRKDRRVGMGGTPANVNDAITLILLDAAYCEMRAEEPLEGDDE